MATFKSAFGIGDDVIFRLNLVQVYKGVIISVKFHKEAGIQYGIMTKLDTNGPEIYISVQERFVYSMVEHDEPVFEHSLEIL